MQNVTGGKCAIWASHSDSSVLGCYAV